MLIVGLPLAASRLEMLQWDRVKHLNFESFCAAYNYYMHKGIAIEIREHLSAWIESNFLYSNFDPENPEHFERISLLCTDFFNEIKRVVQNLTAANHDITIRLNLLSSLSNLQKLCHLDLYRRMRDCLLEERRLLQLESTSQRSSTQGAPNNTLEVSEQLDSIVRLRNQYTLSVEHLRVLKTELRTLLQMRNETQLNISQLGSGAIFKGANPGQYFADKLENENGRIGTTTSLVLEHEAHCLEQVQVLVNNLEGAVHSLDKHFLQLIKWSQPSTDAPLDTVDTWCATALETVFQVSHVLWTCLNDQTIPGIQDEEAPSRRTRMQTILVALEMLKITIMESSLAVLEQPPQIIKKKLAFNSSVKFLGGNKFVRITSPVTTIVLKEFQAAKLFVEKRAPEISAGCGKVANNIAGKNMINQPASTNVTFQFEKLSLSCLRPKEKNEDTDSEEMEESDETASESGPQEKSDKEPKVMEEKYCLVYITDIQIDNVTYTVWCVSIPFVYQVHTNQTVEGLGTIFWDKYFREPGRIPFVVPDKVSWSKMRPALNDHFKMMTKSQRDFSEINLRNLGTHIFQSTDFTDSSEISFSQFFEKDEVSKNGKWGWFQACVDLTNKHLTPYWQNGHIVGFVDRGEAEHLLRAHKPGDFIVRFSNSVEGGVSVTVFKPRGNDPGTSRGSPELEVENSMPFTTGDLDHLKKLKATINISDLIRTYHFYVNSYSQNKDGGIVMVPKDHAFASPAIACKKGVVNMTSRIKAKYVGMKLILQALSEACLSGKTGK